MGIDTRIYLNNHAKPQHIFDVLQKIVGVDFEIRTFDDDKHKVDVNKEAGPDNRWYLKPNKLSKGEIIPSSISYFTLDFCDIANNDYHCLLHFDIEDDDNILNNEKMLSPPATAIWCVLGKRLIDFFGGKMLFADSSDYDDPKNWYYCNNPKFPAKTKEQKGDDRWYQYYNNLSKESLITSKEINDMKEKSSYWNDRDISLFNYLEKYEEACALSKSLKKKNKSTTKKMKI